MATAALPAPAPAGRARSDERPRPAARVRVAPTGRESPFTDDEIIVSKTDLTGHITYVNDVFLRVSGFEREALLGAPHSVIRHPAMPRAVFQLLWDGLRAGHEVFAYIVNLCANGDHYWVFAHVTPTLGRDGRPAGYHSNRRTMPARARPTVERLYAELRAEEARHEAKRDAVQASSALLQRHLTERGVSYDEFVWSL